MRPGFRILALLFLLSSPSLVHAGTVALDYPDGLVGGFLNEVALFRYRLSNTNFDHSIANGGVIPPATWVATRNLGNHNALNGAAWDFTLQHVAGTGYTFTLTHAGGGTPGTGSSVLSYPVSTGPSFNALEMYAQFQNSTNVTAGSIAVTSLAFSGTGLVVDPVYSTLRDLYDDRTLAPGPGGNDLDLQWIVADSDLSVVDWTLTGRVVASFSGYTSGNLDERIKFNIKVAEVFPAPTPVQSTTWGRIKTLMR